MRVLPSEESIALCRQQGLTGKQIIAMQGPFSEEMNIALMKQYRIHHTVTKESGRTGGFEEKASAAEKRGIPLYVIGNPEKQAGLSFAEVCAKLESMTGISLGEKGALHISLLGIGMGSVGTLTVEAKEKIEEADYVFGAKRLLSCVGEWKTGKAGRQEYPYYLAEDIIPILEKISYDSQKEAVILFRETVDFTAEAVKCFKGWRIGKRNGSRRYLFESIPGFPAYLILRPPAAWIGRTQGL